MFDLDSSHSCCLGLQGVSWPWPEVISPRSQCTHTRNPYLGHNSLLSSWMGMKLHLIVVHDTGVVAGNIKFCPTRTCLVCFGIKFLLCGGTQFILDAKWAYLPWWLLLILWPWLFLLEVTWYFRLTFKLVLWGGTNLTRSGLIDLDDLYWIVTFTFLVQGQMVSYVSLFVFKFDLDGGWLVVLRINVDLAIFQPYLDLEAGDNQSLKIQVARPGIEPRSSRPQAKSLTTTPPLLPSRWW